MSKPTRPIEVGEEGEGPKPRMKGVKHKILVMSGKGGVGKTTVTVNLACGLARKGYKVGIMDADIHGPTVPKMLGLDGAEVLVGEGGRMIPADGPCGLKVLSIAFLLPDKDAAVIWRGPLKASLLKKFVLESDWGELDYLLIDLPPGTGDEPLSVVDLIPEADGTVIVSTPQEVALQSVRKSISFSRSLDLRVLGMIENMNGFVCPKCGEVSYIFGKGGAKEMAHELGIRLLGSLPLEARVEESGEEGSPLPPGSSPFEVVVEELLVSIAEGKDRDICRPLEDR